MKLVIVLKHHFLHTWKYKKKEKVKDKYLAKTKFYSLIRIKFGSFYFILKYFINGCRGPPLINLILKIKLIGGNKMVNRPKRRKHKDNPYTLEFCKEDNKYKVIFKDSKGELQAINISYELYKIFDEFELKDLKELNEFDRHTEHSEIHEESLHNRAVDKPLGLDEYIIQKTTLEDLHNAIKQLSIVQQRRIKMYYFDEMTQQEISDKEGVNIRNIQASLQVAITKLKKILKR